MSDVFPLDREGKSEGRLGIKRIVSKNDMEKNKMIQMDDHQHWG